MESIIETFHLDWKLFLAQVVNFTIVVIVLWRFAFKPLAKNLAERTKTIEKSLKQAKEIAEQREKMLKLREQAVLEAQIEAKKVIDETSNKMKEYEDQIKVKTQNQAEVILTKAKADIQEEKGKMLSDVRQEAADLVVMALEKVLQEKVSADLDKKLAEKAIDSIAANN